MAKRDTAERSAPDPGEDDPGTLAGEMNRLIDDAGNRAGKARRWARFWQVADVVLGLAAAVLAAIAGAAGLATATSRVTVSVLALSAAGLAAANQFLNSADRYERNRSRGSAWQALERDARLERARTGARPQELYPVLRVLLRRRIAIMDMDHRPVPANALGGPVVRTSGE